MTVTTNLHPSGLLKHRTFNIITNKEDAFLSILSTARRPSDIEKSRADWTFIIPIADYVFHIIGKGDQLTPDYINSLIASYMAGAGPWQAVDLSKLNMRPSTFKTHKERVDGAARAVSDKAYDDAAPVNFDDPTWQAVRRLAHEVTGK